jgi:hypothetical protein
LDQELIPQVIEVMIVAWREIAEKGLDKHFLFEIALLEG